LAFKLFIKFDKEYKIKNIKKQPFTNNQMH